MRHELGSPDPEVVNTVDGDLHGNVVQAHTVHGGVHVHAHAVRPAVTLPCRFGVVPPRAGFFRQRPAFEMFTRSFGNVDSLGTDSVSAAQICVLSGLGGVGKTQLAVNQAEQVWSAGEIELLVWVTAGSMEAIVSGCARVAAAWTGVDDSDPQHGAQRFLEWLASATSTATQGYRQGTTSRECFRAEDDAETAYPVRAAGLSSVLTGQLGILRWLHHYEVRNEFSQF